MNLDYKQMFENLQKFTTKKIEQEQIYFDLLTKMNSLNLYANKVSKVLTTLPITDQIKALKAIVQYQTVCKSLAEKHLLFDNEEYTDAE